MATSNYENHPLISASSSLNSLVGSFYVVAIVSGEQFPGASCSLSRFVVLERGGIAKRKIEKGQLGILSGS